jgi:protein O-GlcNAc transferase
LSNVISIVEALIAERNYPQAEAYLEMYFNAGGQSLRATELISILNDCYGLPHDFKLKEEGLSQESVNSKYLLIRAWGYGFWSDVHHVVGQLLLAELTHRIPVVCWGENSLFRDASNKNAFELYFQPIGAVDKILELSSGSIYPAKWKNQDLFGPSINQWEGPFSRMAAPYFFNRSEDILVSDFYITLSSLRRWIANDSSYHGLDEDDIYNYLFQKYLSPADKIARKVDMFFNRVMSGKPWVAVHARGSDKIHESPELHRINHDYWGFVDRIVELNPSIGVFLLTDSNTLHDAYKNRYGEKLVVTPALRTSKDIGVHLQGYGGYDLGVEVLVDVLLAIRCNYFVGNKESNVSLAITSMKKWPDAFSVLLGNQSVRGGNLFLHKGHTKQMSGETIGGSTFDA